MTFQGTVNLHPWVRLEHALLSTAVCHANHLAITTVIIILPFNYNYLTSDRARSVSRHLCRCLSLMHVIFQCNINKLNEVSTIKL